MHCIKPSGHLSGLGKSLDRLGCTIQSIPLSAMYGNIILHFFYQYTFVEKPQQGNLLEWFERNVQTVSEVEMCKLYQRWGRQAVWPLSKSPTLPLYYKSLPATALHWKIFPICTVQLLWPSPVEASSSLARLCLARLCPPTCTKWGKETDSRPSKPWLCQDPQHTWAKWASASVHPLHPCEAVAEARQPSVSQFWDKFSLKLFCQGSGFLKACDKWAGSCGSWRQRLACKADTMSRIWMKAGIWHLHLHGYLAPSLTSYPPTWIFCTKPRTHHSCKLGIWHPTQYPSF